MTALGKFKLSPYRPQCPDQNARTKIIGFQATDGGKSCLFRDPLCLQWILTPEVTLKMLDSRSRRWTVIASGLLCGALAIVVLFTNRGAFFSPLAVVVMGAVGLATVLLQLRLQNRDQAPSSSSPHG